MENITSPGLAQPQVSSPYLFDRSLQTHDIRGAQPQKLVVKSDIFQNRSLATSDIEGAKPKQSIRQLYHDKYDPSSQIQALRASNFSVPQDMNNQFLPPNSDRLAYSPKSNQQSEKGITQNAYPQVSQQPRQHIYDGNQEKNNNNGQSVDRNYLPINQIYSRQSKESNLTNPSSNLQEAPSSISRQSQLSHQRQQLPQMNLMQQQPQKNQNQGRNTSTNQLYQQNFNNSQLPLQPLSPRQNENAHNVPFYTPKNLQVPSVLSQENNALSLKHSLLEKNLFNQVSGTPSQNYQKPYSITNGIDTTSEYNTKFGQSPLQLMQKSLGSDKLQNITQSMSGFESKKPFMSKYQQPIANQVPWEKSTSEYNLIGNYVQDKRSKKVDAYKGAGEHFLLNYNGDQISEMRRDLGVNNIPYEIQFKYGKTKTNLNTADTSPQNVQQNKSFAFGHSDIFLGNYYAQRSPTDQTKYVYAQKESKHKSFAPV